MLLHVAAIGLTDLLIIYLLPVLAGLVLALLWALTMYLLLLSPARFDFKADLLRRISDKHRMRSSAPVRIRLTVVIRLLLGDSTVQATFLYRVCRFLVRHRAGPLADVVHAFAKFLTHADLNPRAQIGGGLYLYHGLAAVVGKGTVIGERALVCQGVTLGGGPVLGDDVSVWAGAKVIGRVTIGDGAEVGANAVVVTDVPAGGTAVGVPARVIHERGQPQDR
jgi:serine O-acetyltransferase